MEMGGATRVCRVELQWWLVPFGEGSRDKPGSLLLTPGGHDMVDAIARCSLLGKPRLRSLGRVGFAYICMMGSPVNFCSGPASTRRGRSGRGFGVHVEGGRHACTMGP